MAKRRWGVRFPTAVERKKYPSECSLCRGSIEEQRVNLALPDREGEIRIIEGVPAGVCQQRHEQYFTVETSREIDHLLTTPPSREESVPVWVYGDAG